MVTAGIKLRCIR